MTRPVTDGGRTVLGSVARVVPATVIVVGVASRALAAAGVRFEDVFRVRWWNPLVYVANGVFHGGRDHFAGNVRLWVPLGAVFTWLTSDGHVLLLVAATQAVVTAVTLTLGGHGVGLSVAVLAVAGAILVRSTGVAL